MTITYPNTKVERRIRSLGFRLTPQRDLILRAVAARGEHATFDEIYADVRRAAPHISSATVYRNLEMFSRYRLIHGNEVAGGKVYELASEELHHHLICHTCWMDIKVPDAYVRKLFKALNKQTGFLVLGEHYVFMGLCPDCRQEAGDSLGRFSVYPKFRHASQKKEKKNEEKA
ncbi:MAG: Fur family transcriptional regulator [Anaerolineales bacterium]